MSVVMNALVVIGQLYMAYPMVAGICYIPAEAMPLPCGRRIGSCVFLLQMCLSTWWHSNMSPAAHPWSTSLKYCSHDPLVKSLQGAKQCARCDGEVLHFCFICSLVLAGTRACCKCGCWRQRIFTNRMLVARQILLCSSRPGSKT